MRERLNKIKDNFIANKCIVENLMKFDDIIQGLYLSSLQKANKALEQFGCADHPLYGIKPIINQIENIRQNENVRPSYEIMLNQCVVLLVSYFSSAMEDVFQEALNNKIKTKTLGALEKEEIKLTVGQIAYDRDIVNLFMSKKDISFQDMQSIRRAFVEYIGIGAIPQDSTVNNIILSQACRHCIVHDGAIANKKGIGQLFGAIPRDLKPDLKLGDKILFAEDEIYIIINSMVKYIDCLFKRLLVPE